MTHQRGKLLRDKTDHVQVKEPVAVQLHKATEMEKNKGKSQSNNNT